MRPKAATTLLLRRLVGQTAGDLRRRPKHCRPFLPLFCPLFLQLILSYLHRQDIACTLLPTSRRQRRVDADCDLFCLHNCVGELLLLKVNKQWRECVRVVEAGVRRAVRARVATLLLTHTHTMPCLLLALCVLSIEVDP